ncbi:MAG: PIN domain-containing protein [Planctomycetota bacterium]|nr:PIN domain-containing protein [Planctomycetota bacterium]
MPDEETTFLAAELEADTGLPCPDAFAAATAVLRGARLITGDRHFEKLPADVVVDWIWPGLLMKFDSLSCRTWFGISFSEGLDMW